MSKTITLLTEEQTERLSTLETVIKDNMAGFIRVGMAIREIKEKQLYVASADTFPQYVKKVWDIGKSRARQLIDAADVYENIKETVHNCGQQQLPAPEGENAETPAAVQAPFNEAQARELVKLKNPYHQIKAWQLVNERCPGKVTASKIKRIVREISDENIGRSVKKARNLIEKGSSEPEGQIPEPAKNGKAPTSSMDPAFKQVFLRFLSEIDRVKNSGWQGCIRTVGDIPFRYINISMDKPVRIVISCGMTVQAAPLIRSRSFP